MAGDLLIAANAEAAGPRMLATKLYLPRARATAVTRPRLHARLRDGMRSRLALIAAPAGFGKSTLLAQTLAVIDRPDGTQGEAPQRIGGVSLDGNDNDPARFWGYVFTALERAHAGFGARALAVLRADPGAVEAALAELLNALAEHAADVVLILDDYHVITNAAIHEGISFLLDHAPPWFHLLLASRTDPPLPLARWRARGELLELRAADLRFTPDEAAQFLAETMGLRLDAEAAAALEARTEGWAAGLQLAALSLQGQVDVPGFIAGFSGSHRHVADYLVEEVLERQPEHLRAFLLRTSILERMCGSLCDAVLGLTADRRPQTPDGSPSLYSSADAAVCGLRSAVDAYSQLILNELERANLFLIPLDDARRWYRYHHLFADLLRHRLAHEHPALVAELHRRAALWFEEHDFAAEAVNHALAAADTVLVARLLTAYGPRFAATGQTQTLQRWLDALPQAQVLGSPRLCLVQTRVLLLNREVAAATPYLEAAEMALMALDEPVAAGLRGELLTLRTHVAIERGAFADALALARQALALLPSTERWARSNLFLALGSALMALGETREAIATHAENVRLCRTIGNAVNGIFSATEVVKLRALQGRLSEARAEVQQALAWVAAEGWQQLPPASALHIWQGHCLIEQGHFSAAGEQLARAIQLTQHGPGITKARAYTFLARLHQLQGDRAGANAALATVEETCRGWEPGGERVFFAAHVARVRLRQGDIAAAQQWASERALWSPAEAPSYFREVELLTLTRVAVLSLSQRGDDARCAETLGLLRWLREHASAAGRGAVVLETHALEALGLARRGALELAHGQLGAALALAAPEGVVGTFADLGAPMADLLAHSLARRAANDPIVPYLSQLVDVCRGERLAPASQSLATPGGELLTEREREVLRLFAAGMTSPEIAQHFVVSINTVKTQLKSIYSKLDAHSRAEVVARARASGFIS